MTDLIVLPKASVKFGRLTVLGERGRDRKQQVLWLCRCDCGTELVAPASKVRCGYKKSCGCLARDVNRAALTKHGQLNSRTYRSWTCMRKRCSDENHRSYHQYGGAGVRVCDAWQESFSAFLADMGERPAGHTLDRIDPAGDYTPDNCRWVDAIEQARNRRTVNPFFDAEGNAHFAADIAAAQGVAQRTIYGRRQKGWSDAEVLAGHRFRIAADAAEEG